MNKIRILIIGLIFCFSGAVILFFFNQRSRDELRQKVILAREIHGVLENLLFDFTEARESSIQGVPDDGLWHHRIDFDQIQLGPMEYMLKAGRLFRINDGRILMIADNMVDLRLRRQRQSPDILEVQLKAKKNVTLTINLKVRLHQ